MKLNVTGGGGPTFTVHNEKREDLIVPSGVTGYDAVRMVAEWLAIVPVNPYVEMAKEAEAGGAMAAVSDAMAEEGSPVQKRRKSLTPPAKGDE